MEVQCSDEKQQKDAAATAAFQMIQQDERTEFISSLQTEEEKPL